MRTDCSDTAMKKGSIDYMSWDVVIISEISLFFFPCPYQTWNTHLSWQFSQTVLNFFVHQPASDLWMILTKGRTPLNRVLIEKSIVPRLVKKFITFHGIRRFQWIQSLPSLRVSLKSILILYSNLCLSHESGFLPFRYTDRNFICILRISRAYCFPTHLILHDLITLIL